MDKVKQRVRKKPGVSEMGIIAEETKNPGTGITRLEETTNRA